MITSLLQLELDQKHRTAKHFSKSQKVSLAVIQIFLLAYSEPNFGLLQVSFKATTKGTDGLSSCLIRHTMRDASGAKMLVKRNVHPIVFDLECLFFFTPLIDEVYDGLAKSCKDYGATIPYALIQPIMRNRFYFIICCNCHVSNNNSHILC